MLVSPQDLEAAGNRSTRALCRVTWSLEKLCFYSEMDEVCSGIRTVKLHPQWIIRPSRRTVHLVGVATLFRSALLSEPPDHVARWMRNARLSCQRNLVDESKWRDPVVDHARKPAQENGEDLLLFIASGYPLTSMRWSDRSGVWDDRGEQTRVPGAEEKVRGGSHNPRLDGIPD